MEHNTIISYLFGKWFGRRCNIPSIVKYKPSILDTVVTPERNPVTVCDDKDQPETDTVFNSQISSWAGSYEINKCVGNVALSKKDYLYGTGNVSATYKITPVHAFDDQLGHGDYYLVDATYVINNTNMYHPNHANYHGGVRVRIGGFCLTECEIETNILGADGSSIADTKMFAVSPKPETVINEKTYSIANAWNIGGQVTGGISGGSSSSKGDYLEGTGSASFNWGVSHTKNETYTVSDLTVKNNTDGKKVSYTLTNNNVTRFKWSEPYGLSDCSDFAKSSLTFHSSWIWYIPNAKDGNVVDKVKFTTRMKPSYRSCRFYSTEADYDEWTDSFEHSGEFVVELPNRTPSGIVTIKNDTPETISSVTLYDPNNNVAYASQSSFTSGDVAKFCMPTGKFYIEFKRGNTSSDSKTYKYKGTNDTFDITRCNTLNLVASFDFIEKVPQ